MRPIRRRRWRRNILLFLASFCLVILFGFLYQPIRFQLFPNAATEADAGEKPAESEIFQAGKRVLVVVGHPDDSEFYAAGTLLRMNEAGMKLRLLCLTSGDKAYYPFGDAEALRKTREQEQIDAAARWGADVVYFRFPDGRLGLDTQLIASVQKEIEAFRPDIVMTFDPVFFRRRYHRDHVVTGEVALAALKASDSQAMPMLFHTTSGRFGVDITDRWAKKAGLVRIHRSQFQGERLEFVLNLIRSFAEEDGRRAGFELAEMYRIPSNP